MINNYKIISLRQKGKKAHGEMPTNVCIITSEKAYAKFATEAVEEALWKYVWDTIYPLMSDKDPEKQIEYCRAICRQFQGDALVIFKQNEARIIADSRC
jgi:hypothetical protein